MREREPGEPSGGHTPRIFYIIIAVVFLIANPADAAAADVGYLQCLHERAALDAHGLSDGRQLYKNTMSSTPFWGTPIYFYLLFLLIKVPLPVLLAFVVGTGGMRAPLATAGPRLSAVDVLLWIVPYSLIGAKWLRYTLSLMPFVYMIAAVGIIALIECCLLILRATRAAGRDPHSPA